MALHAQARQLTQFGGVRVGRSVGPVPRPPYRRRRHAHDRGRRVAQALQYPQRQGQLALHLSQRPREAEEPLTSALGGSGHHA